jgi:hypothetical protein
VKKGSKSASKIGAVGLAVCFVAASTGNAWAACAGAQEMAALRAAALRQHLMVAGLACHEAAYFNQFITAYQNEFLESDHTLMRFFQREGKGEDGYNAYKTHEANESSLRSIHDGRFCGEAEAAFYIALNRGMSLAELATYEAPMLHTGYVACERSAQLYDASFASPASPAPHQEMEAAAAPVPAAAAAAPAVEAPQQKVAVLPESAPPAAAPVEDQPQAAPDPGADETADNAYTGGYAYNAYNAPAPNPYYYYGRWYPYAPPAMRQVQGPDGRWYLVPSYVR